MFLTYSKNKSKFKKKIPLELFTQNWVIFTQYYQKHVLAEIKVAFGKLKKTLTYFPCVVILHWGSCTAQPYWLTVWSIMPVTAKLGRESVQMFLLTTVSFHLTHWTWACFLREAIHCMRWKEMTSISSFHSAQEDKPSWKGATTSVFDASFLESFYSIESYGIYNCGWLFLFVSNV